MRRDFPPGDPTYDASEDADFFTPVRLAERRAMLVKNTVEVIRVALLFKLIESSEHEPGSSEFRFNDVHRSKGVAMMLSTAPPRWAFELAVPRAMRKMRESGWDVDSLTLEQGDNVPECVFLSGVVRPKRPAAPGGPYR